jgi:hypothetical protein
MGDYDTSTEGVRVTEKWEQRDHNAVKAAAIALREKREAREAARRAEIDRIADAKIAAERKRIHRNALCLKWKRKQIAERDAGLNKWLQKQTMPLCVHTTSYIKLIPPKIVATTTTKFGKPATTRSLERKLCQHLRSLGYRKFGTRLTLPAADLGRNKRNLWLAPDAPEYDLLKSKPGPQTRRGRGGAPLIIVSLEGGLQPHKRGVARQKIVNRLPGAAAFH